MNPPGRNEERTALVDGTLGDDWLNDLAETPVPVKEHITITSGIELREKIEINNVASQNRAPVLTGGTK